MGGEGIGRSEGRCDMSGDRFGYCDDYSLM